MTTKEKRKPKPGTPKVGDEIWFIRSMYAEADQLVRCVVERVEVDNSGNAILTLAMSRRGETPFPDGVRLEFPMFGRLFTSFAEGAKRFTELAEDRLLRAKAEVRAARKELAEVQAEVDAWVGSTLRKDGAR